MSGLEISLSEEEHAAMIWRAEVAEQRCRELREELFRWQRARNRWMQRAWIAERAVKRALPLVKPIADLYEKIEQRSFGGPPSPLLSVRGEAARGHSAYEILKQSQEERHDKRT